MNKSGDWGSAPPTSFSTPTQSNRTEIGSVSEIVFIYAQKTESLSLIATGYGLNERGNGVRFPAGTRDLSLLHSVQTGPVAHLSSCSAGTRGSSPGVKRQGLEANHLPPFSAEVKYGGAIFPLRLRLRDMMFN
jgi:hypothetical protein